MMLITERERIQVCDDGNSVLCARCLENALAMLKESV